MRWPVVFIFGYLLLGLELTVKRALAVGSAGAESVAPSFVVPFIVFLALSAPLMPTLWVAALLGAAIDICSPREGGAITVIGPYALGSMAGAYFVYTMRGFMRRHWLSMIVLSIIAGVLIELVVVTIFSVRGLYTVTEFVAWRELIRRVLSSLYTGATATVMAGVLLPLSGLFGFQDPHHRRFVTRRM